jgi:hypothetical protein
MKIKKNYFLSGALNDLASQIPQTSRAEDTAPWIASAGVRPKTTILRGGLYLRVTVTLHCN